MEPLTEIIKEKDFIKISQKHSQNLINLSVYLIKKKENLQKGIYFSLIKESTNLEDFLDDHGARNNKTWVYFGEIVASIRNISNIAYILNHVLRRIKLYQLKEKNLSAFTEQAQNTLQFLNDSLLSLCSHLLKEASHLCLKVPEDGLQEENLEENTVIKILPHNIDGGNPDEINENIARVATEFLNVVKTSSNLFFEKKVPIKKLETLIPEKINEEVLRNVESKVHSIQSMYDTYIHKSPVESQDNLLLSLRGYISITLHLLETARGLCHFFERHESNIRNVFTRKRIEKIIPRKKLLNSIINFALFYTTVFMKEGMSLAHAVVEKYTVVDSIMLKVPEGLGFHLRPSTLVAKIVNNYGTKTTMVVKDKEFDASSVIDLMWAGGMIKREGITEIEFRGDKRTLRDLKILANVNYGEDIMGKSIPLPEEISYLR